MEISQRALALLYWYALLLGVGLGAFYDALRITRIFLGVHYNAEMAKQIGTVSLPLLGTRGRQRESRMLGVVVFFEDLLFSILAGVLVILLFYVANSGRIRPPVFLAVGAGFLFYRATLGRLVISASEVIAFAIGAMVRYLTYFLLYPFKTVGKWCMMRIRHAYMRARQKRRRLSRRRFTDFENNRVTRDACGLLAEALPQHGYTKRGKRIVKRRNKAVQSHPARTHFARGSDRGVDRSVCQ